MRQMRSKRAKTPSGGRFLKGVERIGNALPHPVTLFAALAVLVVVVSGICSAAGVSATGELIDSHTLELKEQTVSVVSLLDREGLAYMLTHAVSNFTGFAPLGVVLVTMLGVGCAEGSGYLSALLKRVVAVTPPAILTPVLVFAGVMSNVASDIGYVVLIPIGAMVFKACGRHPMAGFAAAFAGVSGGFSANLFIGTLDPMLAGISTEAAQMAFPGYVVSPAANWYFMVVSTFLIVALGTFITNHVVEPRLGAWEDTGAGDGEAEANTALSAREEKALKAANGALALLVGLLAVTALLPQSFLRNPETGSLLEQSPFMSGLIVLIALLFFIPSVVYGRVSGKYQGEKDVCGQLAENMSAMGAYLALTFAAAQFINYFQYTKIGTILALKGAGLLQELQPPGPVLMLLFILFSAAVNLIMGSASAKWTILAPVFIPMFMLLGYSPELTQVAYRIGDSCTNLITPLMSYFAMIVVFAKKYDSNAGIGTLISTMLSYSLCFLIGWSLLLLVWMAAGLPLGPGAGLFVS